jgi:chromosome segregation ATPase
MIEPIMYIGIGFLVASLLAVMLLPLVHKRAVRLTTRRIEAATPMSIAEIQAEKDHLRAENAMAMRRLEMLVEETRTKAAAQLGEIGKKAEAIHRLKIEVEEKSTAIARLESSENSLQEQLRQTQGELSSKTSLLRETQKALAENESTLARLSAELDQQSGTADYQRIEIAALQTQIEDLKGHVGEFEKAIRHSEERLARERSHAAAAAAELTDERAKAQELAQKVRTLEAQLAEHSSAAQIAAAVPAIAQIDTTALQQELADLRIERDRLQREMKRLQQHTNVGAAAERIENDMLRERIHDVAAEVTRLTFMLEAEGAAGASGGAPPRHSAANRGPKGAAALPELVPVEDGQASLAERIRALQARVSRPSTNA